MTDSKLLGALVISRLNMEKCLAWQILGMSDVPTARPEAPLACVTVAPPAKAGLISTPLIALYVTIDDLLGRPGRLPGRKPKLSDSELACLGVAQVLLTRPSEHRWLRFAMVRLGHLFPYLPQQPGYNKRLRALSPLLSRVLRHLARQTPSWCDRLRLLDATPLPCANSRETVERSALRG